LLERSNAEEAKKIEVLEKKNELMEKKYEDVLDLNRREYEEAQQEVRENPDAHLSCLDRHLDLFHLCNGKIMDTEEPINNKPHQAAGQVGL
jgi:phosphatidate phosphatase PAH1